MGTRQRLRFNLTGVGAIPAFQPEKLDAYEVGLKTELFDRRLRFNIAGWHYSYSNIQVQLTQPGGENTANAAKAKLKGIDMDLTALLADGLTLRGALGWMDGNYKEVINPATDMPFELPGYPADSSAGGFQYNPDGKRTVYSPEWSGNVGLNYNTDVDFGTLDFDAQLVFSSKAYVQPTNRLTLPAYELVNASIGWRSLDDRFGIRVWGKNLTDDRYFASRLESGLGDIQVFAPPRTYGITFSTRFE